MAHFTIESWRHCALCAVVALLAACSDQSATPAASAAAQQSPPASENATTPAAPASQRDATVAELLGSSDPQQPAAPDPGAPAQASPTQTGSATQTTESIATAVTEGVDVEYARVVSVAPVTGPRQVCRNETVTEQRKPNDQHQVAGTVIGAIAGGVIGNQFGGGRGRTLATVGGAVGGGVVGKEVQKNHQSRDTVTRVVKRCHTVDQSATSAPVYDVVYAYQGENIRVRLDHDPGDRLALPIRGIVNE